MNYSPFLLEAATAVWGMDFFNDYLKGKRFILYTDHKPLEKLGHLHSKTMNRLQTALLEHNFVIQYNKGSNMPADYLSRLPGAKENIASISAFDPFQTDLYDLWMQDISARHVNIPEHQPMASNNPETGPSLLHSHDRETIPRQKQTRLSQVKRFQLPKDGTLPSHKVPERSYV